MALNRGCVYREQIGREAEGRTVLAHLAATRRHSTPEVWQERLARGEIRLDEVVASAGARVRPGQVLAWERPPWDEPDVPLHFEVVLEDAALLAVAKPAGLPTLPAGGYLEHTLLTLVRARDPEARPVHRLGRHTSGLVLFARTRESAASLGQAWRSGAVTKRYRALGTGRPAWEQRVITAAIGPVPHPRLGSVHAASPGGRPSRSIARVLEPRGDDTLFEVDIATGRPHQIRIHLAVEGHPLVGDPLYAAGGSPKADNPGLPGDGGYHLHAASLTFTHPSTGAAVELAADAPEELRTGHEGGSGRGAGSNLFNVVQS